MNKLTFVAVAIMPLTAGCPFDRISGWELSYRVTDAGTGAPVPNAIVHADGCLTIASPDCGVSLKPLGTTDEEGQFSVADSGFFGPPPCNEIRLFPAIVFEVMDSESKEKINVVVDPSNDGFVSGADLVGARAEGEHFVVEVVDCVDIG